MCPSQELQLPFIKLAATEVVSGVSGESESTIRDLFTFAKRHAPCVLFMDEVDAICRKREAAQREMERRIVTQLLSCMDGEGVCVGEGGTNLLVSYLWHIPFQISTALIPIPMSW